MTTRLLSISLLLVALGACSDRRADAIVLCHNSNCAHATNPFNDDTIEALQDSLALTYRGRPAIDGVELDATWNATTSTCHFAHDFDHLGPAGSAVDAAMLVADHLMSGADSVSWRGDSFFVDIELKSEINAAGDFGDDAQMDDHISCVFDMMDTMIAGAQAGQRELTVMFEAERTVYFRRMVNHPRWPGKEPFDDIHLRFVGVLGAEDLDPSDLDSVTGDPSSPGVDMITFHTNRGPVGALQSYRALGAELVLWMLDASLETLATADLYKPEYINTSEALVFRRWLEF